MKVTRSQVQKIRIEGIEQSHRLDPVEVIIENYGAGQGKILITCWGESWTGFWGSMGGTIEQFFQHVSNDYLIDKMSDYRDTVPDIDADQDFLFGLVLKERRRRSFDKQEAREAWDYVRYACPDRNSICNGSIPELLKVIEGMEEPWYLDWPKKENHKYTYLSRILDVVREVIKPEVVSDDQTP